MKKSQVLACLLIFNCMSAVASYDCTLNLAHSDNFHQKISHKALSIEAGEMNSGNMGTLFVEFERKHRKITLDINAVMSGWTGAEDATFVIIRRTKKRYSKRSETVSEIMTVKGNESKTGWFEDYKLDIHCQINHGGPKSPEIN